MRAVCAASERGALPAVVSSIRTAVSGTALPSVGPHHPTRERKRRQPPKRSARTRGCPMSAQPLVELREVAREFPVTAGVLQRRVGAVQAVAGVSLALAPGTTFGLVGESG